MKSRNPPHSKFMILFLMLILLGGAFTPLVSGQEQTAAPWWENTHMDKDKNHIHDALDIALELGAFVEDGRISVLVDFDHTPTEVDEELLRTVDFQPSWRFHWIDIISGSIEVERIDELLELPGVVFLTLNGPVEVMLEQSIPEHNVPQVWELGYTGEGMTVAIIDTGIDATHMGIDDMDDDPTTNDPKVIAFYDSINDPDTTDGSTEPYDGHGHGSHCAGISAGTGDSNDPLIKGKNVGVAPGSWLVGVKVLSDSGSGSFEEVMRGMEWCIDKKEEFNIKAATMSLGGVWLIELTQSQEERLTTLANTMVREGIALTIAAGNSAAYGTIGTPGAARDVITVGATNKNRNTAEYSSRGPTAEGLIKPNVAAIGSSVMSVEANTGGGYTAMSGTSMATPMVAGIMCLLLEANPDLEPLTMRSILEYTSEFRWVGDPQRPNNDYGWGFVEADAALAEAVTVDPSINLTIDPDTEMKVYKAKNESEGDAYRYLAEMGGELTFFVEGENADHLEWRPVDGDNWQEAYQDDKSVMVLPIHDHWMELGNDSLWVRVKGSDGVSAPLHILVEVEEPAAADDNEGGFLGLDGLPMLIIIIGVVLSISKKRK